jgi:hypothetical protein
MVASARAYVIPDYVASTIQEMDFCSQYGSAKQLLQ